MGYLVLTDLHISINVRSSGKPATTPCVDHPLKKCIVLLIMWDILEVEFCLY